MAKVSICVPAYKDFAGIRRLFNSIKEQTFTDVEIIVTDDTPGNEIAEIVDEYNDLTISYFHNEKGLGACGNWNRGLDEAKGEYIKIMHQDDFFTFPDSLESFVKMLDENPGAVMGFSGSRQVTIHEDNPYDISDFFDRCISDENLANFTNDYRDLYVGDWVGAPSATIYRNCSVRFDPKLTWIIDVDFYIGLLKDGGDFICSKKPLVSIGVSDNQLTNSCIDDGDINIREYRHLMSKYDLSGEYKYRRKLIDIAIAYKRKYSEISDLGIPYSEFKQATAEHRKYLCDFYVKLIGRKLRNE